MPNTPLLQAWNALQETILRMADQHILDDSKRAALRAMFAPFSDPQAAIATEPAVRTFFEQPPAHVAAVNSLDHSQFVGPLHIPNITSIPLRDILIRMSLLKCNSETG